MAIAFHAVQLTPGSQVRYCMAALLVLVTVMAGCGAITDVVQDNECPQLREVEGWSDRSFGNAKRRGYPNSVRFEVRETWNDDEGRHFYTLEQVVERYRSIRDIEYPGRYDSFSQAQTAADTLWCSRYTDEVYVLPTHDDWEIILDGVVLTRRFDNKTDAEEQADELREAAGREGGTDSPSP